MIDLGPVQLRLLTRAGRYVMPAGFLERRACRRLERRGLLESAVGLPDVWRKK